MVVDADGSDFHKVHQKVFRGFFVEVSDDKRVGFYVGNQLLLLFEDILKVVEVGLWVLLVHELFDQLGF